jgi:hypothetical protein
MTEEKPFSVATLATRWGCSRVHIYWLIENNQLETFNLGPRTIRISALEVRRFEKCGYVGIEKAGTPMSKEENASLYVQPTV